MRYKYKDIICILALILFSSNTLAYVARDFGQQRELFLRVESDIKHGRISSYRAYKDQLSTYPLFPYLRYEYYLKKIGTLKPSELSSFVKQNPGTPIADKLRTAWLKDKAKQKKWKEYLQGYEGSEDAELQCHYIHAKLSTSNNKDVMKYVPSVWLSAKSQPKACDPVFDAWYREGHMDRNMVWQRIKLAIGANNHRLARYLSKSLKESEQQIVELWLRTNDNPSLIKKNHYFRSSHSAINEILVHGISKIARKNPKEAINLWEQLKHKHKFNERHWGVVVREIGLEFAHQLNPEAHKWLEKIPAKSVDSTIHDARLKLAISRNDWHLIEELYNNLPDYDSKSDKWMYWHARALEMIGQRSKSQNILKRLAQMRNYYGFLASSRILKPYSLKNKKAKVAEEVLDKVATMPNLLRAYELKQIQRPHQGRLEWQIALEAMNDEERQAAAIIASEWDEPNWAIIALANAETKNDLNLRFPKKYSDHIFKEAKNNALEPAFLFAITRQESAFIPTARSPAGALGLMQLMPSTAKMLAKQSKESYQSHHDLLHPEKNIKLGSKYVRMMLDKYQNNPALAAASYNAGPHRVARWLPEFDMPADSWIETIPYSETRNYVQNVLTYTIIYQQLLGNKPRMKSYMPIITGTSRVAHK